MQKLFIALGTVLIVRVANAVRLMKTSDLQGDGNILTSSLRPGKIPGFDPDEGWDTVRDVLKKSLKRHVDAAELIVVDGSDLERGGSVNLNPDLALDGEELRNQAVALLMSQNAISGLPDGSAKLHVGLKKASRVVLVLVREGANRWMVKAVSAMKNTETVGGEKWCEAGYIVVDPSLQGKKIGSTLWRALRVVAREMKVEAFFTETVLSNVASLMLQRHNCKEVLVVGLFTEKAACSRYPDRADLQLLVMLFPLVSTLHTQVRLAGIIAAIRGTYLGMKSEGSIETWVENPDVGQYAHPEFLDYQQVLDAVYEDPTLDDAWNNGEVRPRKGSKLWSNIDEWKMEISRSISREFKIAIPETQSTNYVSPETESQSSAAVATAQLQIRSGAFVQPSPMRNAGETVWNTKVILLGVGVLIVLNCVLLGSGIYFRIYPRKLDEDPGDAQEKSTGEIAIGAKA